MKKAQCNGLEIVYQDYGSPSDPAVVLVMGLGAQLLHWPDDLIQPLVEAGYRVIRFDNRDGGASQKIDQPPSRIPAPLRAIAARFGLRLPAPYQLENMAADTIALLDALDLDKVHLVGASLGGMIAQVSAIHYPHRLRSLTSIMSTGAMPSDGDREVMEALGKPSPQSRQEAMKRGPEMSQLLGSTVYKADPKQVADISGFAFDRSGDNTLAVQRQIQAIMSGPARYKQLAKLQMPVLVIHGLDDRLIRPHHGERTAASIPGAKLEMIEGMAHALEPQVVQKILPPMLTHVSAA